MKIRGYNVEFLPLERRLVERRFLDATASLFDNERRISQRRDIPHNEVSGRLSFDLNDPDHLIH